MNSKEGEEKAGLAGRCGAVCSPGRRSAADPAPLSLCPRAVPTAAPSPHLPLYHLEMVCVGFVLLSAVLVGKEAA